MTTFTYVSYLLVSPCTQVRRLWSSTGDRASLLLLSTGQHMEDMDMEDRLAGWRGGWGVNIFEDERNRIALLH
jgi:hypothetical protein